MVGGAAVWCRRRRCSGCARIPHRIFRFQRKHFCLGHHRNRDRAESHIVGALRAGASSDVPWMAGHVFRSAARAWFVVGIVHDIPVALVIVWRLLDEETFLAGNLPGYSEYQNRVRYRWSRSFGNVVPANPSDCRQGNAGEKTSPYMAQKKYTRHGFEMGVFSEQLGKSGFKTPCKIIFWRLHRKATNERTSRCGRPLDGN